MNIILVEDKDSNLEVQIKYPIMNAQVQQLIQIIMSIVIFAFIICLIHSVINLVLDNRPIIFMIAEYAIIVILFFCFGIEFKWYPKGSEWLVFIYTIPVYAAGYLLRLIGVRKDADYINIKLSERKKRKVKETESKN